MTRHRSHAPATGRPKRTRGGASADERREPRTRPRDPGDARSDLSEEELRALIDENVDPDEVMRVTRDADADAAEQEASDHDRDTARDRLEGLLLEQDEDF